MQSFTLAMQAVARGAPATPTQGGISTQRGVQGTPRKRLDRGIMMSCSDSREVGGAEWAKSAQLTAHVAQLNCFTQRGPASFQKGNGMGGMGTASNLE